MSTASAAAAVIASSIGTIAQLASDLKTPSLKTEEIAAVNQVNKKTPREKSKKFFDEVVVNRKDKITNFDMIGWTDPNQPNP